MTGVLILNTAGVQPTGSSGQPSYSGGSPNQCPATLTKGYPAVQLLLGYANQSNGNASVQGVVQPYNVSTLGSSTALASGVSSASGIAWTNSTLNCGSTAVAVVGNNVNGGTYTLLSAPFAVGPAITKVPIQNLWKMAPLSSVTFTNSTTLGATTVTLGKDAAAGQTYYVTENLNLGNGAYGAGGIEVAYAYNAVLIKSVSISGIQNGKWTDPSGLTLPVQTYVPAGFTTVAYAIPGSNTWGTTLSFKVAITTTSVYNANTAINAFVNDIAYYQTNGGMNVTQETLSASGADLGEPYTHVGAATVNSLAPAGAINVNYNV